MYKFVAHLIIIISLFSCSGKKEIVTRDNLRDVLTRFGESHPEKDVIIETSFGTMKIRLYEDTPLHRANFVKHIIDEDYEKGTFYRIVSKFMIQGGNKGNDNYLIPNEIHANHYHKRGAIAMAHYDEGNPDNDSSPTEFYIIQGQKYTEEDIDFEQRERNLEMTPQQKEDYKTIGGDFSLDGKYTVFGEVTEGFDVIEKIANEKVINIDKPVQPIPFRIKAVVLN